MTDRNAQPDGTVRRFRRGRVTVKQRNRRDSIIPSPLNDLTKQMEDVRDWITRTNEFDDDVHQEIIERLDDLDARMSELYWYACIPGIIVVVVAIVMLSRFIIEWVRG